MHLSLGAELAWGCGGRVGERGEHRLRSHWPAPGQTSTRGQCSGARRAASLGAGARGAQQAGARHPGNWLPLRAGEVLLCVLLPSVGRFAVEMRWLTPGCRHAPQGARFGFCGGESSHLGFWSGFTPKLITCFRAPRLQGSTQTPREFLKVIPPRYIKFQAAQTQALPLGGSFLEDLSPNSEDAPAAAWQPAQVHAQSRARG